MKVLAVILCTLCQSVIADECYKKVLHKYCLGGNIQQQMQATPRFIKQHRGERLGLIFPNIRGNHYVMSYKRQIYKVLLAYRPETNSKFKELKQLLETKYGVAKDLSYYPSYVKNDAARFGAIRRGEGVARWQWDPDKVWRIELVWSRNLGLGLVYVVNELDKLQKQQMTSGL